MVIGRVAGILGNTVDGIFIPWGPGDQTINGLSEDFGYDQIFINESDDRNITINPGAGSDLITVGNGDLDHIGTGTITINAGTDTSQDDIEIQDDKDVGSDTYNLSESSGYITVNKPNNSSDPQIRLAQPHITLTVDLNQGNDPVNVDSSVSINNTGQQLFIEQVDAQSQSGTGYSTAVTFNGSISLNCQFEFSPSTIGSSLHNSLTLNGDTFAGNGSVTAFGTQTLTINDTAATDTYHFGNTRISLVDGSQTGTIDYTSGIDVVLNSQHATAASEFDFDLGGLGAQFNTPMTVHAGAGNDTFEVGSGYLADQHSDVVLDGGTGGGDSVEFNDQSETNNAFGYQFINNQLHGAEAGTGLTTLSGFESFTLNASRDDNLITVGTGNTGFTSIALNGGEGGDSFNVTPNSTAEYLIDGGATLASAIDGLTLNANGALRGELSPGVSGAGEYTFSNRHPVFFSRLVSFPHPSTNTTTAPDLVASDDSGRSSTDNVTTDTTPSFTGSLASVGAEVVLYRDGAERGSAVAGAGGAWTIAPSSFPAGDASYTMTARIQSTSTGLLSVPSPSLSVRVDTLEPAAPGVTDLASTSDGGQSTSDNITNDTTPTFSGTVDAAAVVRLYSGQTQLNSTTLGAAVTAYSLTSSTLPDGVKSITVTQEDLAGNTSNASSALSVTIDTVAPAAPTLAPDLQAVSDSGASSADDITRDTTPTFSITGSELLRLQDGVTTLANFVAPPSVTLGTALADGVHSIAARSIDIAGNISALSPALSLTIDTTAPAVPSTPPDLVDPSDTGISSTDNITKDTTPTFAINSSELATILSDGVVVADFGAPGGVATPILTAATHAITAEAVDLAGNHSAQTTSLNVTIDTIAPATPTISPDLISSSDTGLTLTDNITRDPTPTFSGSVTANDIVRLIEFGSVVGSDTTTSTGAYSATTGALADGPHLIRARFEDLAGNQSNDGPGLTITVDTVAPAAPTVAPDMLATSDTGVSRTDNITNNPRPTFTGGRPADTEVLVVEGSFFFGVDIATTNSTYSITSTTLPDRAYNMSTVFEDVAGNVSAPGPALNVTIDTVAPSLVTSAFQLVPAQSLAYTFSEDVGPTLSVDDLQVQNLTPPNAATIAGTQMALNFASNVGTLTFPGVPGGILSNGSYQATLFASGVTDVAGNALPADATTSFFFLNGDANHDASVDVSDLGILATNWQQSGRTFADGDLNFDGIVDVSDLGILATNWQQTLSAPSAASAASASSSPVVKARKLVADVVQDEMTIAS